MLQSVCCRARRLRSTRMSSASLCLALASSPTRKSGQRLARFRQINMQNAMIHHDALEFPDGQVVLLTRLCEGQRATVLQLPIGAHPGTAGEAVRREVREPSLLA